MSGGTTIIIVLLGSLSFAGCNGNGRGLDEQGNPIGTQTWEMPVAFAPTYSNIQNHVFNSVCTNCHYGASAAHGLSLDEVQSYGLLVGVRSSEKPQYLLVEPGRPDSSYLIRKLEGGPAIAGAQMPLNPPRLSQATVNAIRLWILQGARRN
jgi:hypothetical protein